MERAHERNRRDHLLRSCIIADARALPFATASSDVVILHGPLYHLAVRAERDRAWAEASRVLRPDGLVFAFAIARHAGMLYGLTSGDIFDDTYFSVVLHEVTTGIRENNPPRIRSLLKGYFHFPDELEDELRNSGFAFEALLGVAGPAWIAREAEQSVLDRLRLERLLVIARLTEQYPLLSQGLVVIGRKSRG